MPSTTPNSPAHRKLLRREVFPARAAADTAAVLLVGSGLASFAVVLTAMGLAASATSERHDAAPAIVHIIHSGDIRPGTTLPAMGSSHTDPVAIDEVPEGAEAALVTELDGRAYVVLGDGPEYLLEAERFTLRGELEYPDGAVAPVAAEAVPAEYAAWHGRALTVGQTCTARVEGFALLSPMTGSVDYLPLESWPPEELDVIRALLDIGETYLVAELDGCADHAASAEGAPVLARDAALPPMAHAARIERPDLAREARAQILASEAALEAQREYASYFEDASPWWELPFAEIEAEVLRHPTTGEIWVSMRASADEGCGYAAINLWGIYRVSADEQLEQVAIYELDLGARLHQAVDVSGDGELSWAASQLFGSAAVYDVSGDIRADFQVPFFGCAC
jgi:hypothetical protein